MTCIEIIEFACKIAEIIEAVIALLCYLDRKKK